MTYKQHNYGAYEKEIKQLMRHRLILKDKVRYHKLKADKINAEILILETKIKELLDFANKKH